MDFDSNYNLECFMGKKISLFPFNIVTKNKETYPGHADYRPITSIINSSIPGQNSMKLGKIV